MAQRKYTLDRIMTVNELAAFLRVHRSTIYKLVRLGQLPGFRVASEWRFDLETIDLWLAERRIKPDQESVGRAELGRRRNSL